jgi:hypothetical protein
MATAAVPVQIHEMNDARKPVRRASRSGQPSANTALEPVRMPLKQTQAQIVEMADELALANDPRETSAVIAKRMGLQERVVDRVLDLDRIKHKSGLRTLKRFVHDGLVAHTQNMRAVESEVA